MSVRYARPSCAVAIQATPSAYALVLRPSRGYSALAYIRHIGGPQRLEPWRHLYIEPSQPTRPEVIQLDLQGPRQAIEGYCNLKQCQALVFSPCSTGRKIRLRGDETLTK